MAKPPDGPTIEVGQGAHDPDELLIGGGLTLEPQHQEMVVNLPEHAREWLFYEICNRLTALGVDFGGVALPLQRVRVADPLCVEDLRRSDFLRSLRRVRSGLQTIGWALRYVLSREKRAPGGLD